MTAYYNEVDAYAADWLRNLIAAGHIAPGEVDDRSIIDVRPSDLAGFDQCHFFAGIGGWSYALRLAGWPDDRPVWTGSCPCQPFSAAGKRKGVEDERHLWPEFRRLIAECSPAIVFGEQVASADGREWLAGVRADLEDMAYAVGAADLCAASAGAPHIRQRLWWVADAEHDGRREHGRRLDSAAGTSEGEPRQREWLRPDPADGGPSRGLARADGGLSGNGGIQPGTQHGQQSENGGAGGMEHPEGDGRIERRPEPVGRGSASGCSAGRMGDADDAGPQGRDELRHGAGQWSPWGASWLGCTDGKARRVEPGTFPLAHGVPNRVGRLRAYGNAIVPQAAAEFIAAFQEAA